MRRRGIALLLSVLLLVSCGVFAPAQVSADSFTEGGLEVASASDGVIVFEGDEEYTETITPSVRKLKSRAGVLPSKYTNSAVTDVLNQGATSLCWAYSALDGGQIGIMKGMDMDNAQAFSAGHLGYASYHGGVETWSPSGKSWYSIGGNGQIAASTLLRWYGAAPFDKYATSSSLTVSSSNLTDSASHLTGFQRLPSPAGQTTDAGREAAITAIKNAVVNYGAVSLDYYFKKGESYDTETNSVYTSQKTTINHESVIIGWDDSKETMAASPGAFYVKNSYGKSFGENGFLWLSYQDASMSNPYVFQFEKTVSGQHKDKDLYSYDGIGYWVYLKNSGSGITAANVFTAARDEYIDAVGFYVPDGGSYTVELRTNLKNGDPSTGERQGPVLSGSANYFGFYTVTLPSSVLVKKNSDFAVVLTSSKGDTGWMYFEGASRDLGKLFRTTSCGLGQTYLKKSGGAFVDIMSYRTDDGSSGSKYGNACIKAYGNPADGVDDGNGPYSALVGLELREINRSEGSSGESESDKIELTDVEIEANADPDSSNSSDAATNTGKTTDSASAKTGTSSTGKADSSSASTSTQQSQALPNSAVTVYGGVDYSAVYNFSYYMKKYPELKRKYGNNPSGALRYFVKYGMKKMQRASKNFNVKSYVNEYASLRRSYGTNWKKYYLHYIKVGKKQGWHGTGCSKMKNPLTKYKGKDYKKIYNFNVYIKRYPAIRKKYRYDDYGALKYFVKKGRKAGQKAK